MKIHLRGLQKDNKMLALVCGLSVIHLGDSETLC